MGQIRLDENMAISIITTRGKHNDHEYKQAIQCILDNKSTKAVNPLIDVMLNAPTSTATSAAYALGELQDTAAINPLITALTISPSTKSQLTTEAYYAIRKFGNKSTSELLHALNDKSIPDKDDIINLLGKTHDKAAYPELAEYYLDINSKNTKAARVALVEIDPKAMDVFIRGLSSTSWKIRESSLFQLRNMEWSDENKFNPQLKDLLQYEHTKVRYQAALTISTKNITELMPEMRKRFEIEQDKKVRQLLSNVTK